MKKVIFLDRDGTLNVDQGYVYKKENWKWIDGSIEALKKLQDAGFELAIVTNQSGIAREYYTEEDANVLHAFMIDELKEHGVTLSHVAYCPHNRPEGDTILCDCRKPNPGMITQIEQAIGPIDYAMSWTIGDKIADLMLGKNANTKTALIRSKYWEEGDMPEKPDVVVDSLSDAVTHMISSVTE